MNEEEKKITRIMVIIWRWNELKNILDYRYFQDNPEILDNPENGRNKLWDVIAVGRPQQKVGSAVVRMNLRNGDNAFGFLLEVLRPYKEEYKAEIFVFLHSGNGFSNSDASDLLDRGSGIVDQCFLFDRGVNYIYVRDGIRAGLLGEDGRFFAGRIRLNGKRKRINVLLKEETKGGTIKYVDKDLFKQVWEHYEYRFGEIIFALMLDLHTKIISCFSLDTEELITRASIIRRVSTDELLFLRLKSFLGYYSDSNQESKNLSHVQVTEEKRKRRRIEEEKKENYNFENFHTFFQSGKRTEKKEVLNAFNGLKERLEEVLFPDDPDDKSAKMRLSDVKELIKLFFTLMKTIPHNEYLFIKQSV